MQSLKAIVLDMDGTLLKKDGTISSKSKEILMEQKEKGIEVFLARTSDQNRPAIPSETVWN
jgi:hydroxymethylpyrimidine pyrophosphatase-like HAD family hydrolase